MVLGRWFCMRHIPSKMAKEPLRLWTLERNRRGFLSYSWRRVRRETTAPRAREAGHQVERDATAAPARRERAEGETRFVLHSDASTRPVASGRRRWQPPEGLLPEDVRAVIAAATCDRDRLLLRGLWATGARVSEALALRPRDVRRDALVPPTARTWAGP
jgi:integrase